MTSVLASIVAPITPVKPENSAWSSWRRRFVSGDGRVVDTGNGGVSHSEGQSYGLLLSEAHGDRETFNSVLAWTLTNLRVRGDALMAWRWRPGTPRPVEDKNNATDGDLIFAWALLRGALRWKAHALFVMAEEIAADMSQKLVAKAAGRTLLLPGHYGFIKGSDIVVNPSYYAFAALESLAKAFPAGPWLSVRDDGIALLRDARFGPRSLPADWIVVPGNGAALRWAEDHPARFSYDAVRVPLHLAWAGLGDEPALQSVVRYWAASTQSIPASIDLKTGDILEIHSPKGFAAVAAVADAAFRRRPLAQGRIFDPSPADDYYSSSLIMLSLLAGREMPA